MATNMDKGLYQAPQGMEQDAQDEEEIQVELPPEEETEEGEPRDDTDQGGEFDEFNVNLAEVLDETVLQSLANELLSDYDADVASRKEWLDIYVDGIDLLGLKLEDRSEPWEGACAVYHPLLAEALVKFQAETIMETFPAAGPVKTKIIGKITKEKEDAADRVRDDMNYKLTEEMPEYRPEHERLLWGLGMSGNAFKKVYYDPALKRQVATYVAAEDVVVPYGSSSLETAERVTHVMRKTENEMKRLMASGFYREIDLGEPRNTLDDVEKKIAEKMGFSATQDDRYKVLEIQANLIIDGLEDDCVLDGVACPYIITIDKGSNEILAVRRNWDPEDDLQLKRQHFVHYGYIPGFGFYCLGLVHLIGAYAKSGTMLIRQLVDAGTLSNLPGGFKTRGLRVKGDDTPISPGEFRDVDVPSGSIRDNLMPLPYKEPSQVLYTLMNDIINTGRQFANAADLKVSDMSAQAPVGTTLAILERTLKSLSAVQARIHYSMKQEFKLLAAIIRDYTPEEYDYEPEEGDAAVKQADYDMVEVIPVSDPNAATMSQKVVLYQAVMQMAQAQPDIYDMKALHTQMLEVMGVKNISLLIPGEDDQTPKDPVSENMAILNNSPTKAFLSQDHESHIAVHMAFAQDPKIQQMVGQSPNAMAIQAALQAHVAEHLGFAYRQQIEEQLGVPLPPPDEPLPEDVEVDLSRLIAAASSKLLQKNQAEAQQAQQQQQAQDPILMLQQKEIEIKEREQAMKEQKAIADDQNEKARIEIERLKVESTEKQAGARIGADAAKTQMQLAAKEKADQAKIDSTERQTGVKIGADAAKTHLQHSQANNQQRQQHMADAAGKAADRAHQDTQSKRQHGMNILQQAMQPKPEAKPPKKE